MGFIPQVVGRTSDLGSGTIYRKSEDQEQRLDLLALF